MLLWKFIRYKVLFFIVCLTLVACAGTHNANEKFKSYILGISTHDGSNIRVKSILIDGVRYRGSEGDINCCWKESRASSFVYISNLPKMIETNWSDLSSQIKYKAKIYLNKDGTKMANALPNYKWLSDNKEGKGVYLLMGYDNNNEVIVWLSNARSNTNKNGRVVYEIGRDKGEAVYTLEN